MKRLLVIALLVAVPSACSDEGSDVVEMRGTSFVPETFTVGVGEEVVWENATEDLHTVTAYEDDLPEGAAYFASGSAASEEEARDEVQDALIGDGESFTLTFDRAGTYRYFCIPHESVGMIGTIVVEDS